MDELLTAPLKNAAFLEVGVIISHNIYLFQRHQPMCFYGKEYRNSLVIPSFQREYYNLT